ncbi:hypothetical protein ACRQ5I_00080 [Pseudoramibacter alactolyticus]|uniref:hypothetical protein n=1 Tax=Pseudoramibacter alactolyticus TaxID=113287 RepID=UPI003D7F7820
MKAQTFRMTLTAQGPVSIGSGEEISKKEYVFFPEKRRIVVMAMPKLYALAQKRILVPSLKIFSARRRVVAEIRI